MRKLLLFLALHTMQLFAAPPATVTVASTYYNADASPFSGSIRVTSPPFVCAGVPVAGIDKTYTITSGVVSIPLVPNIGCVGTVGYTIKYTSGLNTITRYWSIPASPSTTTIDAVQSSVQPFLGMYISFANLSFGNILPGQYVGRSSDGQSWVGYSAAGEPPISSGTVNQYWRGDKTWQAFPTIPQNTSQLPELTNLYFTNARVLSVMSGLYVPPTRTVAGKALSADISLVKADVGLGNVDNTSDVNKPVSTAQQSALDQKASLSGATFTGTVNGISKAMVGLGNVDNTSDASKPVSSAQQAAIDLRVLLSGSYYDPSWITGLSWTKIIGTEAIPVHSSGSGTPSTTPTKVGDTYTDVDPGGFAYTAFCTTNSNCWKPGGSGGSSATTANYLQAFTSALSVSLTHNAGTDGIVAQCFDGSGKEIGYNDLTKTSTTTATVTFSTAQTGACVINSSGGGSGGGGGGDTTAVSNSGAGAQVLKAGTNVTGRTIVAGANVSVTQNTDTITIAASGGGGGGSITIDGSLRTNVDATTGVNGAVVPMFLAGTASLTYAAIANGACGVQTFTLSGALNGDAVAPGWPASMPTGFSGVMFVSAADTITVRLCNHSGGSVTPTAGTTFKAMILRAF